MAKNEKTRILIVEDEAIVAADLEDGLKAIGYEISAIAVSGEDAVKLSEKHLPNLILMDVRLQGKMTGIEAAQEIGMRFHIPIIYLTAHSDEVTLEQAKLTQPYGYLLKPFNQRELRTMIETALYKFQIERRLLESVNLNRLIIETAHNAFIAMNIEGMITDWNPSAEKIFGWKRSEVIGKPLSEIIIPENLREAHYRGVDRYLKTGVGPILNKLIELRALHRDGHGFPVELTIATAEINGELHFFSFIHDISERKHLEIEQRQREELKRSNQELEHFANITSHDLQEPLRTISMYTELLMRELSSKLSPKGKEFAYHVISGTEKMRQLINDLLCYSQVGRANEEGFQQIDIANAVNEAIDNLQATFQKSGAKIVQSNLPSIFGDQNQLSLLFQNLIGNSIKFRSTSTPVIEIEAKQDNEFWIISVKDNGVGFEQKYAEQIFDIFKRLYGPEEHSGTGIGLAICKKIVSLHGGRIWAESIPDQGTTFYFTLPAINISRQLVLNGMQILIVDDSSETHTQILHLLKATGARIDGAKNGVEAIEKSKVTAYDIILMNIEMAGLSAINVSQEIRRKRFQIPIIGYTELPIDRFKDKIPMGTFDEYWSKSLSREALIGHLHQWYKEHREAS